MRFISPNPELTVCLLSPIEKPDPYREGRQIIEKPGYIAQFRTGDFTKAEKDFAVKKFKFAGLPLHEDALTPVEPDFRIATYDTSLINWEPLAKEYQMEPDEMKELIEQKLQDSVYHGTSFVRFDAPRLQPPWRGYDNARSVKRIVELVQETGSDVEDVIAYERENKNRPEVIEALEALLQPSEPEATVITA